MISEKIDSVRTALWRARRHIPRGPIGEHFEILIHRCCKELDDCQDQARAMEQQAQIALPQTAGITPEIEGLLLAAWLQPSQPNMATAWRRAAAKLYERGLPVPTYDVARRFLRKYGEVYPSRVMLLREGKEARQ